METRANYALIGAFLIVAMASLAAFVIWLSQIQFQRDYAEYDVVFEGAVNGLSEGGSVRYLGIKVGEVTNLRVDRNNDQHVIARIRIDRDTPVKRDSTAILELAGLTGVTFIQLQPGSPESPLKPKTTGSTVPEIETSVTDLEELLAGGTDLLANAQITLSRLNEVLSDENIQNLTSTIDNIETLTSTFSEDGELLKDAASALAAVNRAGESIGSAADTFQGMGSDLGNRLAELSDAIARMVEDARRTINSAETALEATEETVSSTRSALQEPTRNAIEEINLMAQDLRLLIARLDRVARGIEDNPQAFVMGERTPYAEER